MKGSAEYFFQTTLRSESDLRGREYIQISASQFYHEQSIRQLKSYLMGSSGAE